MGCQHNGGTSMYGDPTIRIVKRIIPVMVRRYIIFGDKIQLHKKNTAVFTKNQCCDECRDKIPIVYTRSEKLCTRCNKVIHSWDSNYFGLCPKCGYQNPWLYSTAV